MRTLIAVVAAIAVPLAGAAAQTTTCRPDASDNEAKLLAFFATPLAFSPGGMPERMRAGAVHVALDVSYVPSPSRDIIQPERCYGLPKEENTELSPVFPRPRLALGLPGGLSLEASYIPPVRVADAEPHLFSMALASVRRLRGDALAPGGLDLMLRVHGTAGQVEGAITCPEDRLQQRSLGEACFGEAPSNDTYRPNMFGAEAALARQGERLGVYGGLGVTRLVPRFQVGFQQGDGFFDDTRIAVDLTRAALFAGASWAVAPRAAIALELYGVPQDAVTARVSGRWRVR